MTAAVFFKIIGSFFVKNWRAFVVGAVLAACLWIWCDWRAQAAEIAALKYEVRVEAQLTRQWRDIARHQSAQALEAARQREAFELRLAEALARPPKEVIKWKTITQTVPGVVAAAPDCETGIRELGRLLKGGGS